MKIQKVFLLFALVLAIQSAPALDLFKDVLIEKADRTVNAQTQLVRVETTLSVRNERDTLLKEIYFAIPNDLRTYLRLFTITDDKNQEVQYTIVDNLRVQSDYDATLYKVTLDNALKSTQTKSFVVTEVYWGRMSPLPKAITIFVILVFKLAML